MSSMTYMILGYSRQLTETAWWIRSRDHIHALTYLIHLLPVRKAIILTGYYSSWVVHLQKEVKTLLHVTKKEDQRRRFCPLSLWILELDPSCASALRRISMQACVLIVSKVVFLLFYWDKWVDVGWSLMKLSFSYCSVEGIWLIQRWSWMIFPLVVLIQSSLSDCEQLTLRLQLLESKSISVEYFLI